MPGIPVALAPPRRGRLGGPATPASGPPRAPEAETLDAIAPEADPCPALASTDGQGTVPVEGRVRTIAGGADRPAPEGRARRSREPRTRPERLARLEREGVDALPTADLVALLVCGAGTAEDVARVVSGTDLATLSRRDARHLMLEFSLERVAAARLCAAFALGRRVERAVRAPRVSLRSPALVHELMACELRGLERETFHALLLDGKHRLQSRRRISEGTLTSSLVHPREVFAPAVREGAAALIVVHNHPSGDPDPSPEDLAVTRRLIDAGSLLGVPLLDHVVIAGERYVSLRERMRFDPT